MIGRLRHLNIGAMLRTGGAAAAGQAILLATMPVAARLFDEQAFGVLGLTVALSNLLSVLCHFGYADAIIAARTDVHAKGMSSTILCLALASSTVIAGAAWLMIAFDILGYSSLPAWTVLFVAVHAPVLALSLVLQQSLVRFRNYQSLALMHVSTGAGRGGGQIALGLAMPTSLGLVLSELLGRSAVLVPLWRRHLYRLSLPRRRIVSLLVRRYGKFSLLRALSILINTVNLALPLAIVSENFTLQQVGLLSFALSMIYAPLVLVQKAVGDVFTGRYIEAMRTGRDDARTAFASMAGLLSVLGVLVFAALWLAGPQLFAIVFGETWRQSGEIGATLAPAFGLMMLVLPLSATLNVLARSDIVVYFNLIRLAGFLSVLFFLRGNDMPFMDVVAAMNYVFCISYAIYGLMIAASNGKSWKSMP